MKSIANVVFIGAVLVAPLAQSLFAGANKSDSVAIERTQNRSPEFYVSPEDVGFFMNYTGFTPGQGGAEGTRFLKGGIGTKALEMIDAAEETIIMSVFLYDSFYAPEKIDGPDMVGALQKAFLTKRETHPDIRIAVILDPSHKAYGGRLSPAEKELRENGIDVFYSDLLSGLKKASLLGIREGMGHTSRFFDALTFRKAGNLSSKVFSRARIPVKFDGDPVTLESAYIAFLLKANHRKLLVTDVHGADYEALVTSANPHNASANHVNTAVTVKGDTARYIHNMLRLDIKQCIRLGQRYSHWCDTVDADYRRDYLEKRFPVLALDTPRSTTRTEKRSVGAVFVSEKKIADAVCAMLDQVGPGDQVRIQMFYLSYKPVLKAIVSAAKRTDRPVRLLLDANKDSFNKEKDGTPNRQVAHDLVKRCKNVDVRWYSTHGEQNHAKIMTISNPARGTYEMTTGSCNWTGRNMDGVNMESNLVLSGARDACESFNTLFDLFWTNSDGNEYSLDFDTYGGSASRWKWKRGEKPFYWSTF